VLKPARLVLYERDGCHLCEAARETLDAEAVDYREVDITGDPELEASYREWLPVVEIDGERAFVYHLDEAAFVRKLHAQSSGF